MWWWSTRISKIVGDNAIYDLDKGSAVITGKALKATSKESYVTARDSLEYWTKQGAVVARGNAVAADPTRHIQGDMLVGYFHEDAKTGQKKLYQVEAQGNVIIDNKGDIARAAKAVYNMDSDIATLDGGVKITRGKNQLNGEHAIYDTKTGKAKVTGGKGQVKTFLVPGSDKSAGGTLMPGGDSSSKECRAGTAETVTDTFCEARPIRVPGRRGKVNRAPAKRRAPRSRRCAPTPASRRRGRATGTPHRPIATAPSMTPMAPARAKSTTMTAAWSCAA